MKTIAVIDYGMGNLHSVSKALEHVASDQQVVVTSDPEVIRNAEHVVLPGVGAIRDCMAEIRRLGVDKVVQENIASGKPFLGICVGYQALMQDSEENGGVDCLGQFDGHVRFFGEPLVDDAGEKLKVPHMGWNKVKQTQNHPLWQGIEDDARFYFVHSYYVEAGQNDQVIGETVYGKTCHVALAHDNVVAVQFHPEKSHHAGLQLLKNFAEWDGRLGG